MLIWSMPKSGNLDKTLRYYDSSHFSTKKVECGCLPAHSTFFVKKSIYEKYGNFHTNFKNAADFDLLAWFICTNKITYHYIDKLIVKMRLGAASTSFTSIWTNNIEILIFI